MGRLSGLDAFVRSAVPLAPYTWFRLGGPAEQFAEPRSLDELATLVRRSAQEALPLRLLGGGSNILVPDQGVQGVVVHLSAPAFAGMRALPGGIVEAGGGARLGHAISFSVREGLAGLETLVGIPGSIGGALHGNAGSRGGDIGQWTCQATVMTREGEIIERSRQELAFAYRESSLDELAILSARFQLEQEDPIELTRRMQKQWITKKAGLPLSHQPCGCIFKSPRGMSAGSLIDQAGMKGTRVGGAEVSDRHANFIVADAGAKSQDVRELIEMVRERVAERLGVELELEIQLW